MKDTIVYFSGTGGVKKAVLELEIQLRNRGRDPWVYELGDTWREPYFPPINRSLIKSEYLFVFFPVYAFDAPEPLYRWIKGCRGKNIKTVVISVSGGGEIWPNTGSRVRCIKELEKKGFLVIWEAMLVMPANVLIKNHETVQRALLVILPEKTGQILKGVFSGEVKRTGRKHQGVIQFLFNKLEKRAVRSLGKKIKVEPSCNNCGWCIDHCPVKNIFLEKKPVFLNQCIGCMRCVYYCPVEALTCTSLIALKGGFDPLESEKKEISAIDWQKNCRGILWLGVKRYLENRERF